MFRDAGKAFFGLAFAVVLALFLPTFIEPVAAERLESEAAAAAAAAAVSVESVESFESFEVLPEPPMGD